MDLSQKAVSLSMAIGVGYLDVGHAEFYETAGGFLAFKYNGTEYKRVSLRRALPIGQPDHYISVVDSEGKEVGVIRSIAEFPAPQQQILSRELDRRYYSPTVVEVKSVKDKLGYVYMELKVRGSGATYERNCAVKDVNRNIRMLGEDKLIIFDVDGNRFIVESLSSLDKKSLKRLEPYLF